VEGEAPGYPAAAVRPFKSSCKIEENLTASRPRYGRVMTLSGFDRSKQRDSRPSVQFLCRAISASFNRVQKDGLRNLIRPGGSDASEIV
jgi:hypothetical protein